MLKFLTQYPGGDSVLRPLDFIPSWYFFKNKRHTHTHTTFERIGVLRLCALKDKIVARVVIYSLGRIFTNSSWTDWCGTLLSIRFLDWKRSLHEEGKESLVCLLHCLRTKRRVAQPGRSERRLLSRAPCETQPKWWKELSAPDKINSISQRVLHRTREGTDANARFLAGYWSLREMLFLCFPCLLQGTVVQCSVYRGVMCTGLPWVPAVCMWYTADWTLSFILQSVKNAILNRKTSAPAKSWRKCEYVVRLKDSEYLF